MRQRQRYAIYNDANSSRACRGGFQPSGLGVGRNSSSLTRSAHSLALQTMPFLLIILLPLSVVRSSIPRLHCREQKNVADGMVGQQHHKLSRPKRDRPSGAYRIRRGEEILVHLGVCALRPLFGNLPDPFALVNRVVSENIAHRAVIKNSTVR